MTTMCDENTCVVRGLDCVPSAYFRLTDAKRQTVKETQREKYHGPVGVMRKRQQYLKALQSGLIARPFQRTLLRNGIVWGAEGWRLSDDQ
jgi:hypothetical protein